jgi:hypothetical protein
MRVMAVCTVLLFACTLASPEAPPPVSVRAWVATGGPDGEMWELRINPNGNTSLQISYMLNPLGKMSGEFYATPQVVETIRAAVSSQKFMELPADIALQTQSVHAPDLRLTITVGDHTHEVRLYDPEDLGRDPRALRFLAVWNQVYVWVPLRPKW